MINPQELRLGNIVLDSRDYFRKIECIDDEGVWMNEGFARVLAEGIKPVLLTPDLLEKCGFKQSNEFDDTFRLNQFDVFYRKTYCEWTVDDRGDNEGSKPRIFRHLHQLQNLIYAVTGSELTITL